MAGSVSHIQTRSAALYVQKTAITFSASVSLDQAYGSATIFKVKNLTITPPMGEVDLVNLWGEDALDTAGSNVSATGTFQIQAMEEKSWTLAKATFTLAFSHDEAGLTTPNDNSLETLFHGAGIDIADTPAFTRLTYGDSTTSKRVKVGNIGFVWNNGSGIKNANMNKVLITKMGDIKSTGIDGHWEQECEAVCLAQDFIMENED